jgi:cytoskeletal protein CcmA (bactofilin family)
LIGELHIDGDVRLGGTVEGQVEATGDVEIDDEAKVTASLAGRDVNIRGHVSGHVTARKRLTVAKSGSLNGDVRVARLVIQDGASFSGNVSMGAAAVEAAPKPQPVVAPEPTPAVALPQSAAPQPAAPQPAAPPAPPKTAPAPAAARDGNRAPVERGGGKPDTGKAKGPVTSPPKGKPKR